MSYGTDYDFWDTPIGRAQDYMLERILEKEREENLQHDANKGE